jgi:hypothetical protein
VMFNGGRRTVGAIGEGLSCSIYGVTMMERCDSVKRKLLI